jgi:hypothetical protein
MFWYPKLFPDKDAFASWRAAPLEPATRTDSPSTGDSTRQQMRQLVGGQMPELEKRGCPGPGQSPGGVRGEAPRLSHP